MNWINIHTDTLRSAEYLAAGPVERATWINLLGWCCTQENGGMIVGSSAWNDRQWLQVCGVTKKEVSMSSGLYRFDESGTLVVSFYPFEHEESAIKKRNSARENGKLGGRPMGKKPISEPSGNPAETQQKPTSVISGNPTETNHESIKKDKVRKEKVIEANRIPTTENALRFHKAYGRNEGTAWSQKEVEAFKALGNVSFEDVDLVCRYTEAEKAKGRDERGELKGFHRRDLVTLLNNFAGELDKARDRYAPKTSAKPAPTVLEDPPHWQQWHDETGKIFAHFRDSRNYQKEWFTDWKKEKGYN